jgi:membrane-bound metal-dependent hydrolase YbcI (DUF457 family)
MMALGHAVTGAAAGLYVTALAQEERPGPLLVAALVCAGAALAPDLDHPHSTATKTFGPATRALSRRVASASRRVHERTRSRHDRPDLDGHRAATHTLAFAVLSVFAVWLVARIHPALVLFPFSCMVGRAVIPNLHLRIGWRSVPLRNTATNVAVGAAATVLAFDHAPAPLWLGVMAGLGCLVHCLGDAVTEQGCPVLWPVPIAGRRWYPLGSPRFMRFKAGGPVERLVIVPGVILVTLVFGGSLVLPQVLVDLLSL